MGPIRAKGNKVGPGQFVHRHADTCTCYDCIDAACNPKSSPLSSQVGGNHYSKLTIQPAEYTTRNGLGHLAGDAIAYITRYKDKNGKQDLEKAIHSIQLLIALEYPDHE